MDGTPERPDPRERPPDPAGTRPRHDPGALLPRAAPALGPGNSERTAAHTAAGAIASPGPGAGALEAGIDAPAPALRGSGGPLAEAPHAARFQFLLGSLIALAACAVAALVIVVARPAATGSSGPPWSDWHPSTSGMGAASQIAAHVGPEYRLPSGNQLVLVSGGPLQVAGLPMTVALRQDPSNANGISLVPGTGVLYRLCGLGNKCAIDEGKPSLQRTLLLHREALELALFSFRYMDGIDQVVVFMPPKPGSDPSFALFFRPSDLRSAVQRPLNDTLASRTPTVPGVVSSPDLPAVTRLTAALNYQFSLTQSNVDTNVYLVLRPFAASTAAPATAPAVSASPPARTRRTR